MTISTSCKTHCATNSVTNPERTVIMLTTRCGHCDHEIRYWQHYAASGSQLFHVACLAEAMAPTRPPECWPEDWELEARKHDETLSGSAADAYDYHIRNGRKS